MDTLKKYETKINALISENDDKISKCKARIEELKAEIESASSAMESASNDVDVEGYKNAKRQKVDAEDELDMLMKKYKQFTTDPMISVEEYNSMRSAIIDVHTKEFESYKKKLSPMIREIITAGNVAGQTDERIDSMLLTLQRKVMRITGNNGIVALNDRLDDHSIVWFADNVKDSAEENSLIE